MKLLKMRIKKLEEIDILNLSETNTNQSDKNSQVIKVELIPFALMYLFLNYDCFDHTKQMNSQSHNQKVQGQSEERNLKESIFKSQLSSLLIAV